MMSFVPTDSFEIDQPHPGAGAVNGGAVGGHQIEKLGSAGAIASEPAAALDFEPADWNAEQALAGEAKPISWTPPKASLSWS